MRRFPDTIRPLATTAACCGLASLASCAASQGKNEPVPLATADFADQERVVDDSSAESSTTDASADGAADSPQIERRVSLLDPDVTDVRMVDASAASGGIDDVEVLSGPPPTITRGASGSDASTGGPGGPQAGGAFDVHPTGPAAPEPDTDDLGTFPLDALVGHINGRPLFASEFFEPMDARMRAEASRMPPEQWLRFARDQVQRALRDHIRDELLLAELESSLNEQERVGLFAFVAQLRENLLSQNLGSAAVANRRLLEEEGLTLDQKILQERDRELIRMQLRRAVAGKTIISWREVRMAYERDRDIFNPPHVARFRVIWTRPRDVSAAEAIAARLDAGEPFADIASDGAVNAYEVDLGGAVEFSISEEGWDATRFFGPDVLNDLAKSTQVGQISGPVQFSGRAVWMTLEDVEDRSISLYDAQLRIYDDLLAERFGEAQTEYFSKLIARGSLSNIEEMQDRLFRLAVERYLIAPDAASR